MMDDDLEALRAERDALRTEHIRLEYCPSCSGVLRIWRRGEGVAQCGCYEGEQSAEMERLRADLLHARHTANLFYSLSNTYIADAAIYLGKHPTASDGWDAGEQVGEE